MNIGLIYGTNTGVTEIVAEQLEEELVENGFEVDLLDIASVDFDVVNDYKILIIAVPTWNDGELQDDWDEVGDQWYSYDFSDKCVGLVGTGDQEAYHENFIDAIGKMARPVRKTNGFLFGRTPIDEFEYTSSEAEDEDGMFCGLAIDEDNEPDKTEVRIKKWVKQIKKELEDHLNK